MGWFSNTLTPNRINNEIQIYKSMDTLNNAAQTLATANEFIQDQHSRAQGLSSQAFSLQGVSSSLGRQLQIAENELATYLVDGYRMGEEMAECVEKTLLFQAQFHLPRMQRVISSSGKQIAAVIYQNAEAMYRNVQSVRREHESTVNAAVSTINNADREMNGVLTWQHSGFLSGLT